MCIVYERMSMHSNLFCSNEKFSKYEKCPRIEKMTNNEKIIENRQKMRSPKISLFFQKLKTFTAINML